MFADIFAHKFATGKLYVPAWTWTQEMVGGKCQSLRVACCKDRMSQQTIRGTVTT